jgi:hypothetical protein
MDMDTQRGPNEALVLAAVARGERGSEIGRVLGISRERVRQIYKRATGLSLPRSGWVCPACGERVFGPSAAPHRQTATHRTMVERRRESRRIAAVVRFWARVDRSGPIPEYNPGLGPCWLWTGKARPYRGLYGRTGSRQIDRWAHRAAYILSVGPIPAGLELDHLCRVSLCCNPAHLEAVSHRENILRKLPRGE